MSEPIHFYMLDSMPVGHIPGQKIYFYHAACGNMCPSVRCTISPHHVTCHECLTVLAYREIKRAALASPNEPE